MRILFLTQVLPYPIDAGPKVRAYYNLRYLSEKHSVTLLSFVRASDTPEALSHIKSFCAQVETVVMARSRFRDGLSAMKSLLLRQPFLINRDYVLKMNVTLRKLVKENRFDAIHADQLWMAPYALEAKREAIKNGYRPLIVLDQHNAVHLIPLRMAELSGNRLIKTWLVHESALLADYELQTCLEFDHVVWVTREDLDAVRSINFEPGKSRRKYSNHQMMSTNNSVIPICVDPATIIPVNRLTKKDNILFIGGMHWPPNAEGVTWFIKEVLPQLNKDHPQTSFVAIGKQPPKVSKASQANVFTPGYIGNLDSQWESARVFVVPLRAAGGMRVKILDAWAKGIPVVSTTIGAEGITYHSPRDILIADTAKDFADALHQIFTDNNLAQSLSYNGRRTLEDCYDWRKIYPAWESLYQ